VKKTSSATSPRKPTATPWDRISKTSHGRAVGLRGAVYVILLLLLTTACYQSPNRFDVRGNGQGGVNVKRIRKEPDPAPTSPVASTTAPTTAPLSHEEELEARVRELEAENQRLRQQPTTAP